MVNKQHKEEWDNFGYFLSHSDKQLWKFLKNVFDAEKYSRVKPH